MPKKKKYLTIGYSANSIEQLCKRDAEFRKITGLTTYEGTVTFHRWLGVEVDDDDAGRQITKAFYSVPLEIEFPDGDEELDIMDSFER
jgi:hypothetical protein